MVDLDPDSPAALASLAQRGTGPVAIRKSRDVSVLLAIVAIALAFKIAFIPVTGLPTYGLVITPTITASVHHIIHSGWYQLLLPYQYEPGRYYWSTTVIPFTYAAQVLVSPKFSYLFFSSLLVVVAYVAARLLTAPITLAATMAFMFAFGTQLDYLFTFGNLIALYLVLTYIAINFAITLRLLQGPRPNGYWRAGFIGTLVVVALSNEMWLNYATGLLVATGFGMIWAHRHSLTRYFDECRIIFFSLAAVLGVYLAIRLQFVGQYLAPGAEEELLVTYHSGWLFFDDLTANFFTLLYMVLNNYLPSFVSSSNSLTFLDKAYILGEQHGYDAAEQHLLLASHLFLWRFYAGALVTVFLGLAGWAIARAWRSPSPRAALIAVLTLMVLAGFPTHLAIKMRPYNSVPALPYKAIVSITAFTVLIAYATELFVQQVKRVWARRAVVAAVWSCVLLASLTRPLMQARLLAEVGLAGAGDPLGSILRWFH